MKIKIAFAAVVVCILFFQLNVVAQISTTPKLDSATIRIDNDQLKVTRIAASKLSHVFFDSLHNALVFKMPRNFQSFKSPIDNMICITPRKDSTDKMNLAIILPKNTMLENMPNALNKKSN
jgi:hypothetical protein